LKPRLQERESGVEQNSCEKKLNGTKPPERETRWAEPKWQRRAHERRKQGSSPVAEASEVEKSREPFKGFSCRKVVSRYFGHDRLKHKIIKLIHIWDREPKNNRSYERTFCGFIEIY
jgi:hypothetical protein